MPFDTSIRKVLVIGSGPIVIGQAAEFDYAGAQACTVLKQAGVNVVLCNSNPATIMTDKAMADEIYLEPLTVETLKRIIEIEKPDSLLAGLGGQTGLTLSMKLSKDGFLKSHGVRLIGTNEEAIDKAEDRKLFKDAMTAIGEPCIPSDIADTVEEALSVAGRIGYPVIIRPAFTLGGAGGGVAYREEEMRQAARTGLDASPISQILVEKYVYGWKEIEFETMRDSLGNAIAVCSMENVDPVGVHTGDSIVVAPALTLSPKEYGMLRAAALRIVSALGIVGGCNCQFALNPDSLEYAVIEVNPRVSRSSALASKATGYPIAKITTKIALGYTLDEIQNEMTGKTCACFEPTVDYIVVKFPKWPFDKFAGTSRQLGTQMKATGEVMAIGENFPMALMKAVRGAEVGLDTLNAPPLTDEDVAERLKARDDRRLYTVFEALKKGVSVDEIFALTKIDRFFLSQIKRLVDYEARLAKDLTQDLYREGKRLGYTDDAIRRLSGKEFSYHEEASYRMVDTCGGEFKAVKPYFYAVRGRACEARSYPRSGKPTVIVLGSGPIRIGQGIEFDYSSVHCARTLKKMGYDVVIINNNPETVSTDYDTADRLYFEPLTPEDVMEVIRVENPIGVVVAFGGQTAIKLTAFLDKAGIPILGTSAEGIDTAEDREKFDELLEKCDIRRPRGKGVLTEEEALSAAEELGYPVLLRPSYVIGGQNMKIVHNADEVHRYMAKILQSGIQNPVLVDKYMMGTELEVDVISDGRDILIPGIMEHIERAGVHSGDSIAVYPPYNLTDFMTEKIIDSSRKLALSLGTKGLLNIQYLIYRGELYVIEVNPRASRTVPYISKVTGVPMVEVASRVMLGEQLSDMPYGTGLYPVPPYVAVKVPVFSFEKLIDANAYLGPEMKSTGEVLGIGRTVEEALFKGLTSAGMMVHREEKGVLLSVDSHDLWELPPLAKKLADLGFCVYATPETADAVETLGITAVRLESITDDAVFSLLQSGKISYVVYTGALADDTLADYITLHRRSVQLSVPCFTSLDTANALANSIAGRFTERNTEPVNICDMRPAKAVMPFTKMEATGDDYIFLDHFGGGISCPESLCVPLCNRHTGIGGYGICVMEKSRIADVRMRVFNSDGSNGGMAGNAIRCVGKYLFDKGLTRKRTVTVECEGKVKTLRLTTAFGKVTEVTVDMGTPSFAPRDIPVLTETPENFSLTAGGKAYDCFAVSMGNPHCVVFTDNPDALDLEKTGPLFENHPLFPERTNTEFVRVAGKNILRMRVYERGNGETGACGTGACAAVIAAVKKGYCVIGEPVTVKVRGGDLTVVYDGKNVTLTGDAKQVFEGTFTY